jgi:hypothetical protein
MVAWCLDTSYILLMKTTREQVSSVLRSRGLVEEARGDWRGAGAYVRLDIKGKPGMAWLNPIYNGIEMARETLSYEEVIARFGG